MTEKATCPDRRELESLLAGALPDAEQGALTEHIEGCESCQKTLDVLAANSREEQARHLADPPAPPEPGLEQVMRNAIGDETQATDTPAGAGEVPAFLAPPREPGHLGRFGHYAVLELVGQGGFGLVFKAFDEKLQRIVAIKVLAPELAASATARRRFVREAQAAAAVRNDHVVAIYEVNDEHSPPYLVMEFIAGVSLQDRLDRDGPLEVREILRIGLQTAEGLAAAHKQGLVHRDIKPGNILLENGVQRVKITDFGLARAVDDASLSQSGVIAGTPMYMSPEQAQGEALDHRSDLFSLGSVLFAMCTGRPPFRASGTMAVLKRVCEEMPRSIREINPEVPQRLCDVIAKLHAKQPDARFQSAHEVADVLGQHLADVQSHGRAGSVSDRSIVAEAPRTPQSSRSRRRFAVLLALAPLVALIAFGIWWLNHHPSTPSDPTQPTNPTPAADNDGWVQLFNGTDLKGWKVVRNTEDKWAVEQGVLVGHGETAAQPGLLVTERSDYRNFHFRIEAMSDETIADGGQCFRVLVRDGRWKGYEAQIQHGGGPVPDRTGSLIQYDTGRSITIARVDEVLIKAGEWFTQEVIAEGGRLTVLLNGKIVATGSNRACTKGHLALMAQVGTVRFRKVEVKELPADETEEPAKPFVILSRPNRPETPLESLVQAVGWAQSGDSIEIRGDGPFAVPPHVLQDKRLTIRAGTGFRPVLVPSPELKTWQPFFDTNAALVLEGLEFRVNGQPNELPEHQYHYLFKTRGPVHVANCRFVAQRGRFGTMRAEGSPCELINCQYLGADLHTAVGWTCSDNGKLLVKNCQKAGGYFGLAFHDFAPELHNASIQLTNNTFVVNQPFLYMLWDRPKEAGSAISMDVSRNLLQGGPYLFALAPTSEAAPAVREQKEALLKKLIRWQGRENLYGNKAQFLLLDQNPLMSNLKEWQQFWGSPEEKCLREIAAFAGGDLLDLAARDPERMEASHFRLKAGGPGQGAGSGGKDLGANVDLVGPGKPYEEWKKTDEYKEWRKQTEELMKAR